MNISSRVLPLVDRRLSTDLARFDEFVSEMVQAFNGLSLSRMSLLRVAESRIPPLITVDQSPALERTNFIRMLPLFSVRLNVRTVFFFFFFTMCLHFNRDCPIVLIPPPVAATVLFSVCSPSSFLTAFHHIYPRLHCESQADYHRCVRWVFANVTRADFVYTIPDINKRQRYTQPSRYHRYESAAWGNCASNAAERSRSREHTHTRARARTRITESEGGEKEQNNARWERARGENGMKERIRLRAVA